VHLQLAQVQLVPHYNDSTRKARLRLWRHNSGFQTVLTTDIMQHAIIPEIILCFMSNDAPAHRLRPTWHNIKWNPCSQSRPSNVDLFSPMGVLHYSECVANDSTCTHDVSFRHIIWRQLIIGQLISLQIHIVIHSLSILPSFSLCMFVCVSVCVCVCVCVRPRQKASHFSGLV